MAPSWTRSSSTARDLRPSLPWRPVNGLWAWEAEGEEPARRHLRRRRLVVVGPAHEAVALHSELVPVVPHEPMAVAAALA